MTGRERLLSLLLVSSLLPLAACQPVSGTASAGASGAAGGHSAAVSAKVTLKLAATGSAGVSGYTADLSQSGRTTATGTLRFRDTPAAALAADFTQFQTDGVASVSDAHVVIIGERLYLKVPVLSPMLSGGHAWLRLPLTLAQRVTGIDAAAVIGTLTETGPATLTRMFTASDDLRTVGSQTIDGVRTTHLRGTVSASAALGQLSGDDRTRAGQTYRYSDSLSFDVWVDSGHLPRRIAYTETGSDTPTQHTQITFHYGDSVSISAPPVGETGGLGGL